MSYPAVINTIPVGTTPYGVSSDGTNVWVTNLGSNTVSQIDATTGSIVRTINVGNSPQGVSSDGTNVWVANSGSNTVTQINATTGSVVRTIGVGDTPRGIFSNGIYVWVCIFNTDEVTKIDAITGTILATFSLISASITGQRPVEVSVYGNYVWVCNQFSQNVIKIDATSNALLSQINFLGANLQAISAYGDYVWVCRYNQNSFSQINATTGSVINTITVGTNPRGVSSDGTNVWVANSGSNSVTQIDATNGSVINTITVGDAPIGISSHNNFVWVANYNSNTVSQIQIAQSLTITSVTAPQPNSNTIVITGSGFINQANILSVTFNDGSIIPSSFTVVSDTQINVLEATTFYMYNTTVTSVSGQDTYTQLPPVPICFVSGTPIHVDQGIVPIEKVNPRIHTINNKKILATTKVVSPEDTIVCIEENSLAPGVPNQKTLITNYHGIMYNDKLVCAKNLDKKIEGVSSVPYNGEPLYNILMETHELMNVNNMIVETLNPENMIAKLYNKNVTPKQKYKILRDIESSTSYFYERNIYKRKNKQC